jgi:hypothetical protein
MRKSFKHNWTKLRCKICGRMISSNGLAQYQHHKMHEREQQIILNGSIRESGGTERT